LGALSLLLASQVSAGENSPKANPQKVYRVGYLEGGSYESQTTLREAVKQALTRRGWAKRAIMVRDAMFSPGWDKDPSVYREKALELMNRSDLDLIIAMGTEATLPLLAVNNGKTPILGMDLDDPRRAGILDENYQPLADNFTTCVTPDRWASMIVYFHHVMRFKRLGVMYHDSLEGRLYSAVDDIKEVARDRGFEVVEYNQLDHAESMERCMEGLRYLVAHDVDAFYIGSLNAFDWEAHDPAPLFTYLIKNKIFTFAREGSKLVHLGALMGTSAEQVNDLAEAYASQIIDIFQGKTPKDLVKTMQFDVRVSLNFETAKALGVDFPLDVLISSDEIVSKSSTRDQLVRSAEPH
jgi:ABC-type uncharacterized transport system substrate-binding protein